MRRVVLVALAVGLVSLAGLGLLRALEPAPTTPQAQLDAVAATLRCPTCQGLSVADSPSKVATSMREIIAEQLDRGRSPDDIRAYFVARYGDWILLSPRPTGMGWLVWVLPVAGLVAGVAIVVARSRRRASAALDPDDLTAARAAEEAWRHGQLMLPQTPAGEQLDSAFELMASVREDRATHLSGDAAYDLALHRLAEALQTQRREAAALHFAHEPSHRMPPTQAADRMASTAGRTRRGWAWIGGAAAFALLLGALLVSNAGPRGPGEVITGELPDRGTTADEQTGNGIQALRAAVDRDPSDTRARLQLSARLLQQPGGLGEARRHAEAVLARQADQPDALLLLGLAQFGQGDSAASRTLERYLTVAPSGHPGVAVARSLLERAS